MYPLLFLLHRRMEGKKVRAGELLPTMLPLGMFLMHVLLLYLWRVHPIWIRVHGRQMGFLDLIQAMGNAFWLGLDTTLGLRHAKVGLTRIMELIHTPVTIWMICTFLMAACALGWSWKWIQTHAEPEPARSSSVRVTALAATVYLLLLSPVVACLMVDQVMPSRLLALPGSALAVLVGMSLDMGIKRKWRNALLACIFAGIALEAVVLNTMLAVEEINWAVDSDIRDQLRLTGIRFQLGDKVFLSLPHRHPAWGELRAGVTQFEGFGGRLILLLDAGLVKGQYVQPTDERLVYWPELRGAGDAIRMDVPPAWLERPERVFPFMIRQGDRKLMGIWRAEWINADGSLRRSVEFPGVRVLPEDQTLIARIHAPLP